VLGRARLGAGRCSGERSEPCSRLGRNHGALTIVESDEAERAGEIRIFSLELIERAKRLGTVDEVGEYASVSVIDKEEPFHGFPLSSGRRF
jgi:hypothetical protein